MILNFIKHNLLKNTNAIKKELDKIEKIERKLKCDRLKSISNSDFIEQKIPENIEKVLKIAFNKAFNITFFKGTNMIEKTFNKDKARKNFEVRDFAINKNPTKNEIKMLKNNKNNSANILFSTVEGIGLGFFGIGLPDIVLFIGVILKGIYEISLKYGVDYNDDKEKLFILKLLQASIKKGDEFIIINRELDKFIIENDFNYNEYEINSQLKDTSDEFAIQMLTAKFIQGLPILGIIGGMSNPIYYNKIMNYAELKYRKRYLYSKICK